MRQFYRLKKDTSKAEMRDLLNRLLIGLDGKRYKDMNVTEANLINDSCIKTHSTTTNRRQNDIQRTKSEAL